MQYDEFKTGETFWANGVEWYCGDIAQHHVLAFKMAEVNGDIDGPPYAYALTVFDAYDFPGCFKTEAEYLEDVAEEHAAQSVT